MEDAERADLVTGVFEQAVERHGRPSSDARQGSAFWSWHGISRLMDGARRTRETWGMDEDALVKNRPSEALARRQWWNRSRSKPRRARDIVGARADR